jgi:hypothetical protein
VLEEHAVFDLVLFKHVMMSLKERLPLPSLKFRVVVSNMGRLRPHP